MCMLEYEKECKVIKFGDSHAITLPSRMIKEFHIKKGEYIQVKFMVREKSSEEIQEMIK